MALHLLPLSSCMDSLLSVNVSLIKTQTECVLCVLILDKYFHAFTKETTAHEMSCKPRKEVVS